MAKLIFTESYEKRARKFIKKHPELIEHYGKVLRLLALNPNHPSLRLHKLKGRLDSLSSVSINYAYRITLIFLVKKDTIIPVDIGQHDEVY
jgi:mRNA-degrading endonuclease YafQ of YafQ-DinJ toxin-antitoxin module